MKYNNCHHLIINKFLVQVYINFYKILINLRNNINICLITINIQLAFYQMKIHKIIKILLE